MNNQNYEKARQECWDALRKELLEDEVQWQPVSRKEIVNFVFDRAYALGKQDKDGEEASLWNRLTDDEKREMQCRYHTNECVLRDHKKRTGDKAQSKAVARMKLLENLFGKDNLKTHNNG